MKNFNKIISIMLVMVIFLISALPVVAVEDTGRYDLNYDGVTDITDYILAQNRALKGEVNPLDLKNIKRVIMNVEPEIQQELEVDLRPGLDEFINQDEFLKKIDFSSVEVEVIDEYHVNVYAKYLENPIKILFDGQELFAFDELKLVHDFTTLFYYKGKLYMILPMGDYYILLKEE